LWWSDFSSRQQVYTTAAALRSLVSYLWSAIVLNFVTTFFLSIFWISIELGQKAAGIHFQIRPRRVIWIQRLLKYVPKAAQLIAISLFVSKQHIFVNDFVLKKLVNSAQYCSDATM
jgi:hypothetical protein